VTIFSNVQKTYRLQELANNLINSIMIYRMRYCDVDDNGSRGLSRGLGTLEVAGR